MRVRSQLARTERGISRREWMLGSVSLGTAAFAGWKLVDTFGWVLPQLLHPVHRFDYPPGEPNEYWVVPCLVSLATGLAGRRTAAGRLGLALCGLILLGIALMFHWGIQWWRDWLVGSVSVL